MHFMELGLRRLTAAKGTPRAGTVPRAMLCDVLSQRFT
jgi:hypothetical protein